LYRKNGLTDVALLAEGFNLPARKSDRYSGRDTQVPHRNFAMNGSRQKATRMHILQEIPSIKIVHNLPRDSKFRLEVIKN
jgi:hypothetical protein